MTVEMTPNKLLITRFFEEYINKHGDPDDFFHLDSVYQQERQGKPIKEKDRRSRALARKNRKNDFKIVQLVDDGQTVVAHVLANYLILQDIEPAAPYFHPLKKGMQIQDHYNIWFFTMKDALIMKVRAFYDRLEQYEKLGILDLMIEKNSKLSMKEYMKQILKMDFNQF